MIKADKGMVTLEGKGLVLLAELSGIVHSLNNTMIERGVEKEASKKTIISAVEDGFQSNDDLKRRAEEAVEGIGNLIHRILDEILGDGKDEK